MIIESEKFLSFSGSITINNIFLNLTISQVNFCLLYVLVAELKCSYIRSALIEITGKIHSIAYKVREKKKRTKGEIEKIVQYE